MDCSICFEKFNLTDHMPLTLLCGHTFCVECLDSMSELNGGYITKCAQCRKEFKIPFSEL